MLIKKTNSIRWLDKQAPRICIVVNLYVVDISSRKFMDNLVAFQKYFTDHSFSCRFSKIVVR